MIIHGRSDATLNPGGVRIGTAEIYRQVEKLDEIKESIAVGQDWKGDVRVVLFVVLKDPAKTLDEALADKIKTKKPLDIDSRPSIKLKELFFAAKDQTQTYDIYRKNLESLFKNTFLEKSGSRGLNLESARASYHFLILNLLIGEKSKTKLSLLSESVKD